MRIVFISGPLWSPFWFGRLLNIWRAWRAAWRFWRAGNAVICPHTNSGLLTLIPLCGPWIEGTGRYLDGHIEMIARLNPALDQVHLVGEWRMSSGASLEYRAATRRGLQCSFDPGCGPWPEAT
jgi:hypothetical protein